MRLRKKHGGCTIAGHEWAEDGAVAEVPDELGAELLELAPGEYEQLLDDDSETKAAADEHEAAEAQGEEEAAADEPEQLAASRAQGRKPRR